MVLVLTLKFLALKNPFPCKNYFQIFLTFVYLYSMQLFSANPTIFSKKNLNQFFAHENFKKRASKVDVNFQKAKVAE